MYYFASDTNTVLTKRSQRRYFQCVWRCESALEAGAWNIELGRIGRRVFHERVSVE